MKKILFLSLMCVALCIFFSCGKDDDKTPTTGILKGKITDVSNSALSGVRVIVFDATTNSPTQYSVISGSDGAYKIEVLPGTYYLKLSKQGYMSIPATGVAPVSLSVELGKETLNDFSMNASSVVNGGSITGKVTSGGNPVSGAMVFASDATMAYSAVSGTDGSYYIYNVPAGAFKVKAFIADYNSPELAVDVVANTEASGKNLTLTTGAAGSISGTVTFLATNNGAVDVTLTNPLSKETIPGLVTKTLDGNYALSKVPDGTYIAKASFNNDGYVVDPDWIVKNGEPLVNIAGGNVSLNFSVTGAVKVISPTNDSTSVKPVEVTEATPTFTWQPYSSVNDYVIEVSDINGNVIWGGFTKNGTTITKNIVIPKTQLSIVYNSDGKATATLKSGSVYRWRVFASKVDAKEASGWKLISVSEDQKGLFKMK